MGHPLRAWDGFAYRYRRQRERRAYARWARRRRVSGRLRFAWFRVAHPVRARRSLEANGGWTEREPFADGAARPSFPRRVKVLLWSVSAILSAIIIAALVWIQVMKASPGGSLDRPIARVVAGVTVPNVTGMSVSRARQRLDAAGLVFDRALPVRGSPGVVIGISPAGGSQVPAGTLVTLLVGVEPDRLRPDR
jgi:hypothetical protein